MMLTFGLVVVIPDVPVFIPFPDFRLHTSMKITAQCISFTAPYWSQLHVT